MSFSKMFRVTLSVVVVLMPLALAADTTSSSDAVVDENVIKTTPSKVCNPKQPISCRTDVDFSELMLSLEVAPAQQTRVCYGPRWMCNRESLQETGIEELTKPRLESQEARVCYGPRWMCNREELK